MKYEATCGDKDAQGLQESRQDELESLKVDHRSANLG